MKWHDYENVTLEEGLLRYIGELRDAIEEIEILVSWPERPSVMDCEEIITTCLYLMEADSPGYNHDLAWDNRWNHLGGEEEE